MWRQQLYVCEGWCVSVESFAPCQPPIRDCWDGAEPMESRVSLFSSPSCQLQCGAKKNKIWQNKQKNTRLCDALTSIESTLWVQQHLHTLRRIFWPSEVVLSVWTCNVRPVACRETTELKDEVTARCAACRLRPSRRWADSWLISVFSCSASLRFHDYLLWTPLFCFNDAKRTRGMKQNRIWTS